MAVYGEMGQREHGVSRAFVKEEDGARPPPIPERPVSTAQNLVTPRGARLISETIANLQGCLANVSDEEAETVRRDLRYWLSRRTSMRVVPPVNAPEVVAFGARVTIRRRSVDGSITIVGEDEADPPAGLIAWTAPLARALAGARVNDVVELQAGGRIEAIEVVALSSPRAQA